MATLRAWLDRPGQVQAVAAALDVHPQTVRYRLERLRELFGARWRNPEARFELSLASRPTACALMGTVWLLRHGALGMLGTGCSSRQPPPDMTSSRSAPPTSTSRIPEPCRQWATRSRTR